MPSTISVVLSPSGILGTFENLTIVEASTFIRDLGSRPTDFRKGYPALYLRNFSCRIDSCHLERPKMMSRDFNSVMKSRLENLEIF